MEQLRAGTAGALPARHETSILFADHVAEQLHAGIVQMRMRIPQPLYGARTSRGLVRVRPRATPAARRHWP
ncbi:hypothetical protein TM239_15920 [Bradyrhizobium sp. TM239]|nr:hypothetical protein TM239_15920 [Bradyrhizobium sp. TM239]